MLLTIIGCSGSMSGPDSSASCYLLQAKGVDEITGKTRTWSVVFDLGPGSFGALWKHIDPSEIDAVIFSHGHADHMADVMSLQVHHRWHPQGPLRRVVIFGPECIAERTAQIDGWATPGELAKIFDFRVVQDRQEFRVGPFVLTPFAGRHSVPSFGYRVLCSGQDKRAFAYTGDTDTCESITQMSVGASLLLSEAAFTESEMVRGIHLDGLRAAQIAKEAQVGQLVLTHIQPWTDPQETLAAAVAVWSGEISIAVPGAQYLI